MLADRSEASANAAAEVMGNAGYEVSVAIVDVSSREAVHALVDQATGIGEIVGLIHAAGVSPSQASPETILHVELYGTAVATGMTHIAIAEMLDGKIVGWFEHVTHEQYGR